MAEIKPPPFEPQAVESIHAEDFRKVRIAIAAVRLAVDNAFDPILGATLSRLADAVDRLAAIVERHVER